MRSERRGLADGAARPANQGTGKDRKEPAPMGNYTDISRVVGLVGYVREKRTTPVVSEGGYGRR
jgi:hypothetical protein